MRWTLAALCPALLCGALLAPAGAETNVEPKDPVDRVDLYVLLDRSGSMSLENSSLKNNLATVVDGLQCPPAGTADAGDCIPDLWAGAGTIGYSGSGAAAFQNIVDLNPSPNFAGIPTTEPASTNSTEPLTFAIHATITGDGGAAYGMASVPARSTCAGSPADTAGYTTFGYPCFRVGAIPVVVLVTDEPPISPGDTLKDPGWSAVVKDEMLARGARLVGLVGDNAVAGTLTDLSQMATDTRALDAANAPLAFGVTPATAPTVLGDAIRALVHAATAPEVSVTAPTAVFQLGANATPRWSAIDGNGFGIATHDVRYRRAPYTGAYGGFVYPSGWQALPAATSQVTQALAPGYRYCFSARSTDTVGQTSSWSGERCTGRPLDDRALSATAGWTRGTGSGYYADTFTKSTRLGAILTRTGAQAVRLALVATRCPTCGKVKVQIGSYVVGTVNLHASTTSKKQLIVLPAFTYRTGTVKLTVTTSGKPVIIDGLGISR